MPLQNKTIMRQPKQYLKPNNTIFYTVIIRKILTLNNSRKNVTVSLVDD